MSDSESTPSPSAAGAPVIPLRAGDGNRNGRRDGNGGAPDWLDDTPQTGDAPPPGRPRLRLRKLRVFAVLSGLTLLGIVSFLFGIMMAVASDLPTLEDPPVINSRLVDVNGKELGLLTGSEQRVFVDKTQIAPVMKHAIIAVEDQRFYTNEGVDLRGVGRALYQDVVQQRVVQGGSTITQQFVKNALAAHEERTLFNKLREATLAYHLTRQWSKERILRNYLNTIYFGNGAYGIESAARVYFGANHTGCEEDKVRPCAARLEPHEAALLAGIVASPSGYDPIQNRQASKARRDLVLTKMVEQGYLSEGQRVTAEQEALPTRYDIRPPREDTRYPYFTSWVKQQVVDKLGGGQQGARRAFEGGLTVRTTLDIRLQEAAQAAVDAHLPSLEGPRAAMVVIDNASAEVRAMVAGDDYEQTAFNLATQGRRQPGSAFKPFVLATALENGVSPTSVWSSRQKDICINAKGDKCREYFEVNNYEDAYAGVTTLARATTFSDNSVFAEVGLKIGTDKIARTARRMGVRTPISKNAAMTLGGLRQGVTPLDMAHAYETFAAGGRLTYGTMSPGTDAAVPGPVAIKEILDSDDKPVELPDGEPARNKRRQKEVLKPAVAEQVEAILGTVVTSGTAVRAKLSDGEFAAGKTGTTENYGDAWFVGWTKKYTVAVWVGYPDRLQPMETEYAGEPVAGGTYPAAIWRTFMEAALSFEKDEDGEEDELPLGEGPVAPGVPADEAAPDVPSEPAPTGGGAPAPAPDDTTAEPAPAPAEPAPEQPAPAEPAPAPAEPAPEAPPPAPDGGEGGATAPG